MCFVFLKIRLCGVYVCMCVCMVCVGVKVKFYQVYETDEDARSQMSSLVQSQSVLSSRTIHSGRCPDLMPPVISSALSKRRIVFHHASPNGASSSAEKRLPARKRLLVMFEGSI